MAISDGQHAVFNEVWLEDNEFEASQGPECPPHDVYSRAREIAWCNWRPSFSEEERETTAPKRFNVGRGEGEEADELTSPWKER